MAHEGLVDLISERSVPENSTENYFSCVLGSLYQSKDQGFLFCHGVCKCNLVSNETFDKHCTWFWDLKNSKIVQ